MHFMFVAILLVGLLTLSALGAISYLFPIHHSQD